MESITLTFALYSDSLIYISTLAFSKEGGGLSEWGLELPSTPPPPRAISKPSSFIILGLPSLSPDTNHHKGAKKHMLPSPNYLHISNTIPLAEGARLLSGRPASVLAIPQQS